ncbi:MAG: cytochrome P450, partial [Panacagrimonas sp.]
EQPWDIDANDQSLPVLQGLQPNWGDVVRVRTVTRPKDSLVVSDPDHLRWILLTNRQNYRKGVGLERVRMLLGNGLIVSDGDFWARQRRMMQPAFHSRVIRQFAGLIERHNAALMERWALRAVDGEPVNVTRETSELSLNIVLQALFSLDLDKLTNEVGEHPFTMIARDSQRDLRFAAQFRALTKVVRQMIEDRRREQRVEMDFLSMLMEARDKDSGEAMPEKALIDEIMSLIVAGHETTAATLNWTWYRLSQHPQIEARLHAAVEAAPAGAPVAYAEQVLHETLRLYPPVWLFSRRAIEDDRLGPYRVPAGADLFVCPYLLHRDPRHWRDPETYDPDRFTPEAEASRHRFAFIPFSAGARHCIGEGFAMVEMNQHLRMAVSRFRLKYAGPVPPPAEFQVNLRTREDLLMQVIAR